MILYTRRKRSVSFGVVEDIGQIAIGLGEDTLIPNYRYDL
jgi:hypothetical protein